jgi:hypothetical protein
MVVIIHEMYDYLALQRLLVVRVSQFMQRLQGV